MRTGPRSQVPPAHKRPYSISCTLPGPETRREPKRTPHHCTLTGFQVWSQLRKSASLVNGVESSGSPCSRGYSHAVYLLSMHFRSKTGEGLAWMDRDISLPDSSENLELIRSLISTYISRKVSVDTATATSEFASNSNGRYARPEGFGVAQMTYNRNRSPAKLGPQTSSGTRPRQNRTLTVTSGNLWCSTTAPHAFQMTSPRHHCDVLSLSR